MNTFSNIYRQSPNQVWRAKNQALNRKECRNALTEITVNGNNLSGVLLAEHFSENFANAVKPLGSAAHTQIPYHMMTQCFLQPQMKQK